MTIKKEQVFLRTVQSYKGVFRMKIVCLVLFCGNYGNCWTALKYERHYD